MRVRQIAPIAPLRAFIDRIWSWRASPGEVVDLPTLLPGTGAELYIHNGEPFRLLSDGGRCLPMARSHLSCLRHATVRLGPTPDVDFIAVRFRAGMAARFAGIVESEVIDRAPSAEDLWGAAGRELCAAVAEAGGFACKMRLIQDFLLEWLRSDARDPLVERTMVALYRSAGASTIADLAKALDLGPRQFERRFRDATGLTPAAFKGLSRFQHTVRQVMLDGGETPAGAALSWGYYDQSHFIRDFRRRVGEAPNAYFRVARAKTHFYNPSWPARPRS